MGPGTSFAWDDGTAFDYESWHTDALNSNEDGEDGLVINWWESHWNDWWKTNSALCLFAEPVGRPSHYYIPFSFLLFFSSLFH